MNADAIAKWSALLPRLDSTDLSLEAYRQAGAFVVRRAVSGVELETLRGAWEQFAAERLGEDRQVNPYNPVVVNEVAPDILNGIHRSPALVDLMSRVYPDLALYMQRFLVKDAGSQGPVFLHQDFGYDHGWPEKTSVFLALSPSNVDNGGLILFPGTHTLGYLGDVGEIDPEALGFEWPSLCPALDPGDAVLMHECLWHASHPYSSGPNRVLVQITYQPSDDPSGVALLRGVWRTDLRLQESMRERVFKRSRSSRLRELQAQVERTAASAKERTS